MQYWPENLSPTQPATWGQIGFAVSSYSPPLARAAGTVTVQRGLPGSTVIDSTVGDDGSCGAAHEGDPNSTLKPSNGQPHGLDTSLYIGAEAVMTHLPCYGRGYLRFNLNQVPPGKVIISAQLTLYHWSQSGELNAANPEDRPSTSYIKLYQVDGGWTETGVTWNNSPLAKQDLGGVWVPPRPSGGNLWPGIPYTWNATSAVANAYYAGQPVDLALYTPDTGRNSLKYFTSSDAGDWNAVARPKLTITYGDLVSVASQTYLPSLGR
ncbi:MAG TPA: DNRLRE domain-containing protein [Roseiflexaceae bacterium]|nr:DNRLRE domain-containing protein [Roseiflexaceae bacterium]